MPILGYLSRRDTFSYRPLAPGEIRMLSLERRADWPSDNTITCSLRHANINDLTDLGPYTALSYVWGDGQNVTGLELTEEASGNSGEITITCSLLEALQTMFTTGKSHRLWVDQICINQSNSSEKGPQIELMRRIYAQSAAVNIWIGPASDDSRLGMEYLKTASQNSILADFLALQREKAFHDTVHAVESILLRPYWTRMWTVMESTSLGHDKAWVFCGDISIELLQFHYWKNARLILHLNPEKIDYEVPTRTDGIDQVLQTLDDFFEIRSNPSRRLYDLISSIHALEASDPRDKVYCLLDYATDVHGEIKVDYRKSLLQVYTEFFLWHINKYQCLDLLGESAPSVNEDSFPTWLPDWRRCKATRIFPKTEDGALIDSTALFSAGGSRIMATEAVSSSPIDVETRLLSLSGVRIGNLHSTSGFGPKLRNALQTLEGWQPRDSQRICTLNNLPMSMVFHRTIFLDSIHHDGPKQRFTRLSSDDETFLPWTRDKSSFSIDDRLNVTHLELIAEFRSIFYTSPSSDSAHGLLGYADDNIEPGDELWILKGGKMPFVLRPKPMTVNSTDPITGVSKLLPVDVGMPTYQYVSEAFVLGLMDGEVFDLLGEHPKRERPPPVADMDREFRTIGLL